MSAPTAEISEAEAVRIAEEACVERGIAWREPYRVKRGWRSWSVRMPSNMRGGNAVIAVSRKTGQAKVRFYAR